MKIDLNKIQSPKCFHLIWCLLGVCILWQLGTTMARSAFLPRRVQKALEHYKESTEKNIQMQASKVERKSEPKSMFAPPKKVQMPTCSAVLGDEALINDKWYKVGSTAGGAKIVAINPESVKILWEEKEHTLVPFNIKVESAESRNGQSQSANKEASTTPRPDGRVMRNTENATTGISSDEARQMRERYENASSTEQQQMRQQMQERYENASPEEQEQMRQQMRQSRGRG
jgi:hypothetical protein